MNNIETGNKLDAKYDALVDYIKKLGSVAVGFSGGVDSSFLLAAAVDALGKRAFGVVGQSATHPEREHNDAVMLAEKIGARLVFVKTNELANADFYLNPPTRCYTCKRTLFSQIWKTAKENGAACVLEGSNADDLGDFRPGMDASKELQVKMPLVDLKFTKLEIRTLSQKLELPSWNKPSFACLASRIPYGQPITVKKLSRIEQSENVLFVMGFSQLRVRDYGELCRIEVLPEKMAEVITPAAREKIVKELKQTGYKFVTLDLDGYRTGSMNEMLSEEIKKESRNI